MVGPTVMAGVAATKFISNVADDLYVFLKERAALTINKKNVERKLHTLISRIQSVRLLKTLWQVDTAVDVESFYCDSHVIFPAIKRGKKIRKKIDNISDFGSIRNIVIRGIAGQGKSIFLRHLCIREFEAGHRIPIFIELRRIQTNETIRNHISQFLDILDLPIDDKLLKILLQSGKFIFFFDAFDEIPEAHRLNILNELENLSASYENTKFLITTRPNTAIEMSPFFDVVTLDDLREEEYKAVIRKLTDSPNYANTLIKTIECHEANIAELLCNPLLVTLLLISYKSFQKLPEKLSDFYDSIFDVLLRRHDGTKPGFMRKRRCSVNDNLYRQIFDAFCFDSKKIAAINFKYQEIYKLAETAINRVTVNVDADSYLRDIKDITCLILQEGEEYRFIHKSVQEYYAASFIKNRPDDSVKGLYSKCLADYNTAQQWQQELGFLSEIDQYRYSKYYLIPLCHKWLGTDNNNKLLKGRPKVTTEFTKNIIGGFLLEFELNDFTLATLNLDTLGQILDEIDYVDDFFHQDYREFHKQLTNKKLSINKNLLKRNYFEAKFVYSAPRTEPKKFEIVVEQIMGEGYFINEYNAVAKKIVDHIYRMWKQAYSYVAREDSFDIAAEIEL